jgi:uncharacterized membrane protein YfcA
MTAFVVAVVAGALLGLSLGTLGGGGSILAVPVLVHLLGQTPAQATTGSLVVVGVSSLLAAVTARRAGRVLLGRGIVFGLAATGGAVLGAEASSRVPGDVLMAAFAVLMLVVAALMLVRQLRPRSDTGDRADVDEPILRFSPTFVCACPRALKVLVTATVVGLLTGFLGVGGGFLVVPALVLAMSVPMHRAAGTSLVVITITSATALAVRTGSGVHPDWGVVLALTAAATVAAMVGARFAGRVDTARLTRAFTALLLAVAAFTGVQAALAL